MDQLSLASGATALASVINRLLDSKLTHRRKLLEAYAREQGIGFFEELIAEEVTEQGDGVWELAAPESNLAKYVAALALQLFQSTALQSPHSLKAI